MLLDLVSSSVIFRSLKKGKFHPSLNSWVKVRLSLSREEDGRMGAPLSEGNSPPHLKEALWCGQAWEEKKRIFKKEKVQAEKFKRAQSSRPKTYTVIMK